MLGWLISDTPEHRDFLIKELNGEVGAIDTFYKSKKYIIEEKQSPFTKEYSYDKFMKEFKQQCIKPNII